MILLTSTSDLVRVVTAQARNIDVHASWLDNNAGVVTPGRTNTLITTATTTTVVGSPASSVQRNMKTLNICNREASNSCGIQVVHSDGTNIPVLFNTTINAGEELEYVEGYGWNIYGTDGTIKVRNPNMFFKCLSADDVGGQNVATAQPWFPTAGGVLLPAATSYFFEGWLLSTRTAGATSHTTGLLFGGTATLTNIDYEIQWRTGDANAAIATNSLRATAATNTVFKAASTSTTEDIDVNVDGIVRINAAGTFIPQFIYSAAPGGTPTVKRGSYFRMWPIGDNNVTSVGTWA